MVEFSGTLDTVSYVFHAVWRFEHDADAVYAALADVAAYPSWWPQFRAAREVADGVGELRCRSLLPYDLTFLMRRETEDAANRVLLTPAQIEMAGLTPTKEVEVIGVMDKIEIWSPKRLETRQGGMDAQKFDALAKKFLS